MIAADAFRTADAGSDYFETEIHYRALAERIVVAVQDARRFIVVTGDPPPDPSGLSASLNAVLVHQHPVTALFSAAELLHVRRGPLAARKGASDSQAAVSRPLLFIINNAARLADHQIEYIYEKSQSDDRHIVVLLGRSDFLACHDRCKFLLARDARIRCLRLHDLGRQEILQFLRHQVGSGEAGRAFTDDVVAAFWSQSRGDPRIVNGLARRLLDGLTNTADRPDLGVPPSPAPDPAREASGQAPLANIETPAAPAEASLSEPDAAAAPSYPAAGRPSADGQSAWRLRNTNTETAPVAVFPASSLQCELPTRAAWDRPTGPSPASPLNGSKDPRSDEATGTDARTAISLPAIQDAPGLVPAWPSSVPSLASPAARASLLPGWRHATILSWPILAAVLCLVGVGLVGTVVLHMRGHPTGPTQSDVVPSPSSSPEAASSTAPKPPGAALGTAEPEADPTSALPPPPTWPPPVDATTPPVTAPIPSPAASPAAPLLAPAEPEANATRAPLLPPTTSPPPVDAAIAPVDALTPPASPPEPPLAPAQPAADAIPAPLPPAPSPPPVDVATPPKTALTPGPTPTSPSPPVAALVVGLVERGDMLFSTGDMAAARLFYERAANVGDAQAALRLGESFDPNFLQAHARGVKGDPVTAISWYRRARELGSADAEILLKSLEGN